MDEQPTGSQNVPSTPPTQGDFAYKQRLIGVLSYISVLVIVAHTMADKDERLMYHVRQGAVLCIAEIAAVIIFSTILMFLWPFMALLNVFFLILSIIGIVNALKRKDKPLPILGTLTTHLPF